MKREVCLDNLQMEGGENTGQLPQKKRKYVLYNLQMEGNKMDSWMGKREKKEGGGGGRHLLI